LLTSKRAIQAMATKSIRCACDNLVVKVRDSLLVGLGT